MVTYRSLLVGLALLTSCESNFPPEKSLPDSGTIDSSVLDSGQEEVCTSVKNDQEMYRICIINEGVRLQNYRLCGLIPDRCTSLGCTYSVAALIGKNTMDPNLCQLLFKDQQ